MNSVRCWDRRYVSRPSQHPITIYSSPSIAYQVRAEMSAAVRYRSKMTRLTLSRRVYNNIPKFSLISYHSPIVNHCYHASESQPNSTPLHPYISTRYTTTSLLAEIPLHRCSKGSNGRISNTSGRRMLSERERLGGRTQSKTQRCELSAM